MDVQPSQKTIENMQNIKNIILVLSGKGGVGKSTAACSIALSLAQSHRVGLLDIDITGPSIPKIVGLEKQSVFQSDNGYVPITHPSSNNLQCMSLGFLLGETDVPVIWRGPKKHSMIRSFVEDVAWGSLDYLVIDTSPGTSDEHISIAQLLRPFPNRVGAVLISTPQRVALADVRRELNFCKKLGLHVFGVIENMSGYVCPCCGEISYIFSKDGAREFAEQNQIPFLGSIPIDPTLSKAQDEGREFVKEFADSASAKQLIQIVERIQQLIQERQNEMQEEKQDSGDGKD